MMICPAGAILIAVPPRPERQGDSALEFPARCLSIHTFYSRSFLSIYIISYYIIIILLLYHIHADLPGRRHLHCSTPPVFGRTAGRGGRQSAAAPEVSAAGRGLVLDQICILRALAGRFLDFRWPSLANGPPNSDQNNLKFPGRECDLSPIVTRITYHIILYYYYIILYYYYIIIIILYSC